MQCRNLSSRVSKKRSTITPTRKRTPSSELSIPANRLELSKWNAMNCAIRRQSTSITTQENLALAAAATDGNWDATMSERGRAEKSLS